MFTNEHGVPVDQWKRPLIAPPGVDPTPLPEELDNKSSIPYRDRTGAKPYTRISTISKLLDKTDGLQKWELRETVRGIAGRPDLLAMARTVQGNEDGDKRTLDNIARQAKDAAKTRAAANLGTATHTWIKLLNRGLVTLDQIPAEDRPTIDAYAAALATYQLRPAAAELFVVVDDLQVAGTFDVFFWCAITGTFLMGDAKTGAEAPTYSHGATQQIAIYSHGTIYSVAAGRAANPLPVDHRTGLLFHMPIGTGVCDVYDLDLAAGWAAAQHAVWTHGWQKPRKLAKWDPASQLAMAAMPPVAVPA